MEKFTRSRVFHINLPVEGEEDYAVFILENEGGFQVDTYLTTKSRGLSKEGHKYYSKAVSNAAYAAKVDFASRVEALEELEKLYV